MEGNVLGGGVLFAAIALLWVAVLVPSIIRRRAFRAAEQNAARLQRTLRILAETAEVPEEHRVEANAKEALAYEKKLQIAKKNLEQARKQEQQMLKQKLKHELLQDRKVIVSQKNESSKGVQRSNNLKPFRLIAAGVAALGLLGLILSAILALASVASAGMIFVVSFLSVVFSLGFLVAIAPGARNRNKTAQFEGAEPVENIAPVKVADFDVAPKNTQEKRSAQEHAYLQAIAKAESEKAKTLAAARARAREEAQRKAVEEKRNLTGSILLDDKPKPQQKASLGDQSKTSAQIQMQEPNAQGATKTSHSAKTGSVRGGLTDQLNQMGVVGDISTDEAAISNIDAILKRRRDVG